jgi:dienelactone hydrolase
MTSKRACPIPAVVWLVLAATAPGGEEKPAPKPASWLQSLAARAERMAAQTTAPADAAAWEKHRAERVAGLAALLGMPPREPMKAATLHQRDDDGLIVEEVAYLWAERAYVYAHVVRSKEAGGSRPAIVITPGWQGHFSRAAYRGFVGQMARQGWLVLFVGDPHIGKRNSPEAGLYGAAGAAGVPVLGIRAFDALRGLDYLLTRPDADPGRIGLAGLEQGAQAACLAGALENRFRFVVLACGPSTCRAMAAAAAREEAAAPDASVGLAGMLRVADWDHAATLLAPRPVLMAGDTAVTWLPSRGQDQVADAMKRVYSMLGAEGQFRRVRAPGRSDLSGLASVAAPWLESQAKALKAGDSAPLPCGKPENPDFSMLRYLRRRTSPPAAARRDGLPAWLAEACGGTAGASGAPRVVEQSKKGNVLVETLDLPLDAELRAAARLFRTAAAGEGKRAAVVLSHDGRQCPSTAEVVEAAQRLVERGYWVILPEHASPDPKSLRHVPGEDLATFYAVADAVGLPPLALRVKENLAAAAYLAGRPEVDAQAIVAAGQGTGSVDACLAALLDPRIAGVAALDATTMRDWAENVAPDATAHWDIVPYLPSMLLKADLNDFYALLAPRPLLLAKLKDGWPKTGFQQVAATAAAAYRLQGKEGELAVVSPREVLADREGRAPPGVPRQLIAVARSVLPPPPAPGSIGSRELVKNRAVVDSAAGLVWLVEIQGGVEQEFIGGGYRLATWSFFNDNGQAQRGASITPLVFKKEGAAYKLTGVGKTRANTGEGFQSHPFEATQGTDEVSAGCFFGFYTGDPAGKPNAGVVEFDDGPKDRMTILTLDGAMEGQALAVGKLYGPQSSYPRTYSLQAISERKP